MRTYQLNYTDVEGDPHSPVLLGWVRVQLTNAALYRREARNPATITRYITWELIGWLAVVLVGLTGVLVLMVVLLEASRMNLGLGPTLRLLPFSLPLALAYAAPCATLFTVCLIYGRMSADNEVIATKALGISPLVLLWPAWIIAFGLSLVGVWLTDLAFSWGAVGAQRVVIQSVEEIAYGIAETVRVEFAKGW